MSFISPTVNFLSAFISNHAAGTSIASVALVNAALFGFNFNRGFGKTGWDKDASWYELYSQAASCALLGAAIATNNLCDSRKPTVITTCAALVIPLAMCAIHWVGNYYNDGEGGHTRGGRFKVTADG